MANLLKISGSTLLLLAALLAAGARADIVTTTECKVATHVWWRVRRYPVDSDASWLNMYNCSLTGVEQQSITGLPAVSWLWLHGNKLRELPVLDEHVCPNLTRLYLQENQLTDINNAGAFSACTKIEELYLNHNQIQFIHHSVFTAMTDLRYLHLNNNKIRYVHDQMFSNNGKLEELYLNGNIITQLPLEFASKLARAAPKLIRFRFYDNPWQCACLIELLADVQRTCCFYYNNYYEFAFDGREPACVYTGAAPCSRPGLPSGGGGPLARELASHTHTHIRVA